MPVAQVTHCLLYELDCVDLFDINIQGVWVLLQDLVCFAEVAPEG